mmetsp:Transcript_14551/g.39963  ORF Transcript_14551/g.39963 Transcript_14551/m.39963 type:complete len:233 (-) Transcript_14551:884-1582(-)
MVDSIGEVETPISRATEPHARAVADEVWYQTSFPRLPRRVAQPSLVPNSASAAQGEFPLQRHGASQRVGSQMEFMADSIDPCVPSVPCRCLGMRWHSTDPLGSAVTTAESATRTRSSRSRLLRRGSLGGNVVGNYTPRGYVEPVARWASPCPRSSASASTGQHDVYDALCRPLLPREVTRFRRMLWRVEALWAAPGTDCSHALVLVVCLSRHTRGGRANQRHDKPYALPLVW